MANKSKQSMAEQLNAAQMAINNSLLDAEIRARVAGFGYDETRLNQGKALYEAALAKVNAQTAGQGTQFTSTSDVKTTEKAARDAYQALAQVARALYGRDQDRLAALGLSGTMPRSTAGFLAAAYTLFDNAQTIPGISGILV
ncbi:MAG: hypothetical protein M3347_15365 [Armatimonadota bacterium]|nr:hypothetical protein [Armatimonadota bacterium]